MRVTRRLLTSLNSFTRVCNGIIKLNLEIIIEYTIRYIDVDNYLNVIYNETLLY